MSEWEEEICNLKTVIEEAQIKHRSEMDQLEERWSSKLREAEERNRKHLDRINQLESVSETENAEIWRRGVGGQGSDSVFQAHSPLTTPQVRMNTEYADYIEHHPRAPSPCPQSWSVRLTGR